MKWILPAVFAASAWSEPFAWNLRGSGRLELTEAGRTVFVYNHGAGRECCYLHPVASPAGVAVTDDGPADHKHHRGVFWAWPVVEVGGKKADLWLRQGAEHRFERILRQHASAVEASLTVAHSWMVAGRRAVKEKVEITVHPASRQRRAFDVALTLEALDQPVDIAGSPERGKGYGGFSSRFAPRRDTVLRSNDGAVGADEDHVPHAWAELEGTFQGGRAGLRITSNRANPVFPNQWCLRQYGFAGATFPGVAPYRLEPGKPVTLRYRVEVFDASLYANPTF